MTSTLRKLGNKTKSVLNRLGLHLTHTRLLGCSYISDTGEANSAGLAPGYKDEMGLKTDLGRSSTKR